MINILPGNYVVIKNPVITLEIDGKKAIQYDSQGQALIEFGKEEIRYEQEPFPLHPGEVWKDGKIHPLIVVSQNQALRLKANIDFVDIYAPEKPRKRQAGEEWWFKGHGTYYPQVEVSVLGAPMDYIVSKEGEALLLAAKKQLIDANGVERYAGCRWLHHCRGAYLPDINEEFVKKVKPIVVTDKLALVIKASRPHFDELFKVDRLPGDEWLVTSEDTESYLLPPDQEMVRQQPLFQLQRKEFLTISNPHRDGKTRYDEQDRRRGDATFFLQPGESTDGPRPVYVLTTQQAIEVQCVVPFEDNSTGVPTRRVVGEKWFIEGPREYFPVLEVVVTRVPFAAEISAGEKMNLFLPLRYYLKVAAPFLILLFVLLLKIKRWLF